MTLIVPSRRGFLVGLVSLLAAPAVVRAGSLMPVRNIGRFLPAFGFDSFSPLNADSEYQWCAETVLGQPNPQAQAMVAGGWRAVPASRYSSTFNISGERIERGGCVLMERSRVLSDLARAQNADRARGLVSGWADMVRANGFSGFASSGAGAVTIGEMT